MIHKFADWLVFEIFGLSAQSQLGAAVNFFFYDTIKILLILFIISLAMGFVHSYFPVDRLRDYVKSRRLYGLQYLFASLFGAITPFCSYSSTPFFIGLVRGGLPMGVTFSFLITSPLVNEVAVAMILGAFGLKATLLYAVSGIALGTIGGFVLSKFKLERFLSKWVQKIQSQSHILVEKWKPEHISFDKRFKAIVHEAWGIVFGVLVSVVIGIAIGALIHGFVPDHIFEFYLSKHSWYSVPLAVILAVPLYANAAGAVPVIEVLVAKGASLGTAIAFMMAMVGLSWPEAKMLKKVAKWPLIWIFFGVVAVFIITLGYLFNLVL